jgi:hypothetical protein
MQRRAAAAYAGLFVLIAVGAYAMVGVVQEPAVTVENPDHSLGSGDTLEVGDRTYTVDELSGSATQADRSATLSWTNASERQTATIDNGTEIPVVDVVWSGQTARQEATLANGSTVSFNGSDHTLLVEDDGFTLQRDGGSESFSVGDAFSYRGNATTVTAAGNGSATLAWGDSYRVVTQTASNDSMDFREVANVTAVLTRDPDVQNETASIEGAEYVRYRNGSTQLLSAYLPDPEIETFSEGETLTLDTAEEGLEYTEVTVANVSAERVLLSWRGPVPDEVSASHAGNVTLGPDDQLFVAHFPDNDTLELTSDYDGYQSQLALRSSFNGRVNGLWGISILSGLTAVFLIGAAYLPSRY